jgi:hypothetical protein
MTLALIQSLFTSTINLPLPKDGARRSGRCFARDVAQDRTAEKPGRLANEARREAT